MILRDRAAFLARFRREKHGLILCAKIRVALQFFADGVGRIEIKCCVAVN